MKFSFSENSIIDFLQKNAAVTNDSVRGIGDDAAIFNLNDNESYIITTDMLAEGVHFRLTSSSPKTLAVKSIEVNLSDLAAMGGEACFLMLSISLPSSTDSSWVSQFFDSFIEHAKKRNVVLLGGDTINNANQIVINVTAIGKQNKNKIKFRNTATMDDLIVVTGDLGLSLAAFQQIEKGGTPSLNLQKAFHEPRAHLEEGLFLANCSQVTSMMDISDGLLQDLTKLCNSSRCGFQVELSQIPTNEEVKKYCESLQVPWDEFCLSGGDDYCLLFTIKKDAINEIASLYEQKFGKPFFVVGKIIEEGKREFLRNGKAVMPKDFSFKHFP